MNTADAGAIALSGETWRPVFGFEGLYEVSDMGRVRSLPRVVSTAGQADYLVRARVLKPFQQKAGYFHLVLRKGGTCHTRTVHRLVLEAFIASRPAGLQCCHNNGDPSDNRLMNLRWDSPRANQADRIKHGTGNQGFKNPRSFLSPAQIIAIREATGSHACVARQFGVSDETARRIRIGARWAEVVAV